MGAGAARAVRCGPSSSSASFCRPPVTTPADPDRGDRGGHDGGRRPRGRARRNGSRARIAAVRSSARPGASLPRCRRTTCRRWPTWTARDLRGRPRPDGRRRPAGGRRADSSSTTSSASARERWFLHVTIAASARIGREIAVAGHVPLPGVAVRARDPRPVRDPGPRASRSAPARPARVLAGGLLPAPQGRGARDFHDDGRPFPFRQVDGEGVYEIPVGPVHAGIIEPGHFRFSVVGETIIDMKSRLYFTHKGTEKLFEGRHARRTAWSWPSACRATRPSVTRWPSARRSRRCAATVVPAARAVPPRRAARARAALQPRRRLRHDRQRHRLRRRPRALLPDSRAAAAPEQAADGHRLLRGRADPGGVARRTCRPACDRASREVRHAAGATSTRSSTSAWPTRWSRTGSRARAC